MLREHARPQCQDWGAEGRRGLVVFCAFRESWVDHLYLLPAFVGQTIGKALPGKAKQNHAFLQLWVCQENRRAISFCHRNGVRTVRQMSGSENGEELPDALLEWRRPA